MRPQLHPRSDRPLSRQTKCAPGRSHLPLAARPSSAGATWEVTGQRGTAPGQARRPPGQAVTALRQTSRLPGSVLSNRGRAPRRQLSSTAPRGHCRPVEHRHEPREVARVRGDDSRILRARLRRDNHATVELSSIRRRLPGATQVRPESGRIAPGRRRHRVGFAWTALRIPPREHLRDALRTDDSLCFVELVDPRKFGNARCHPSKLSPSFSGCKPVMGLLAGARRGRRPREATGARRVVSHREGLVDRRRRRRRCGGGGTGSRRRASVPPRRLRGMAAVEESVSARVGGPHQRSGIRCWERLRRARARCRR